MFAKVGEKSCWDITPSFSVSKDNCILLLRKPLNDVGSKSFLLGAYYKPHEFDQYSLDELSKSLDMVKQTSNIWLIGDFNMPEVDCQS